MKNRKNKEEGKMGRPRAFAAAKSTFAAVKSTFAAAKSFAAEKGCFAAAKQNGQNGHPRVRCSKAVLHRGEGTIHTGQIFMLFLKVPVFVHRLFRNPNKLSMGV